MQRMQQATNMGMHSALRRLALVVVVMIALAVMFFASCMMVSAHAAVQQGEPGQSIPGPGPSAPEPVTF